MRNALSRGIVAGLAASIPIGLVLSAVVPGDMGLPNHSLMEMIAAALGTRHLAWAWVATLGAGALLGVIFGAVLRRSDDDGTVASGALFIALGLWVVVAAVVAPLMVGARPVVGLTSMRAWPFAVGALMLLLGFWSILAGAFVWMRGPRPAAEVTTARDLRRAA